MNNRIAFCRQLPIHNNIWLVALDNGDGSFNLSIVIDAGEDYPSNPNDIVAGAPINVSGHAGINNEIQSSPNTFVLCNLGQVTLSSDTNFDFKSQLDFSLGFFPRAGVKGHSLNVELIGPDVESIYADSLGDSVWIVKDDRTMEIVKSLLDNPTFQDSVDPTKQTNWVLAVATGNVRTATLPDFNATLVPSSVAKGGIPVGASAGVYAVLAVGTDNFVLTADHTATDGVAWKANSAGSGGNANTVQVNNGAGGFTSSPHITIVSDVLTFDATSEIQGIDTISNVGNLNGLTFTNVNAGRTAFAAPSGAPFELLSQGGVPIFIFDSPTGNLQLTQTFTLSGNVAVADLPGGGSIGSAATTVDIAASVALTQTTAGQTVTVPNPTDTTIGRQFSLWNTGSTAFTYGGTVVTAGSGIKLEWSGSVWIKMI